MYAVPPGKKGLRICRCNGRSAQGPGGLVGGVVQAADSVVPIVYVSDGVSIGPFRQVVDGSGGADGKF